MDCKITILITIILKNEFNSLTMKNSSIDQSYPFLGAVNFLYIFGIFAKLSIDVERFIKIIIINMSKLDNQSITSVPDVI